MNSGPDASTPELISRAVSQTSSLIRDEVLLARAEISERAAHAVTAVGVLVGAVVIGLVALNVLAAALVVALTKLGLPGIWAALMVGVSLAVLSFLLIQKGTNDLKASNLAPSRALRSVKKDAQAVKDAANGA